MTMHISKSLIVDSGINVDEFPAQVEAFSVALRAWLAHMQIFVAEMNFPPMQPEMSDYPSAADYRLAVERYAYAMSHQNQPYLPPDVPAVVIIALNKEWLPDFETIEDSDATPRSAI